MSSSAQSSITMDKTGRNDPCPCGSGKKYKKCCLSKHQADQRRQLAEQQAERDQRTADHRSSLREVRAAITARLAGIAEVDDDPLIAASNAVVELIHAGKLDEAEHAARDLLARFPDVHDGYDRLGMVHEARGENRQAADCYRRVIAFIRQHPDDYDDAFEDAFVKLVAKLDPPPSA
jgi:tetratricopeptide (TPR) repeat protein